MDSTISKGIFSRSAAVNFSASVLLSASAFPATRVCRDARRAPPSPPRRRRRPPGLRGCVGSVCVCSGRCRGRGVRCVSPGAARQADGARGARGACAAPRQEPKLLRRSRAGCGGGARCVAGGGSPAGAAGGGGAAPCERGHFSVRHRRPGRDVRGIPWLPARRRLPARSPGRGAGALTRSCGSLPPAFPRSRRSRLRQRHGGPQQHRARHGE